MEDTDQSGELDRQGRLAEEDMSVEDVPGGPTWPVPAADVETAPPIPPVGLNWGPLASKLGIDRRILEHDGAIVFPGEYFPEAGFFVDPVNLTARHVDVGDMALRPGYFLGDLSMREFRLGLILEQDRSDVARHPVIRRLGGPLIGLFVEELGALRVRERIVRGSLGTGITVERGPLGYEVRVERPELPGRVATIMAAHGGALISAAGRSLAPPVGSGPTATGDVLGGDQADAWRGGTGAAGDSSVRSRELGGSEEEFSGL